MKKILSKNYIKYIFIGFFLILIILCIIMFRKEDDIVKSIDSIKYFRFSYSNGYMANSSQSYEINCDEKCILTLKPKYIPDDEAVEVELSKEEIDKLIEIINKYNVSKWNGFNKSDKYVLDGDSFSLSITALDNEHISAMGYMMYPKNYGEFRSEVDSMFEKYIPEELKNRF